jgi:hypothetical protein
MRVTGTWWQWLYKPAWDVIGAWAVSGKHKDSGPFALLLSHPQSLALASGTCPQTQQALVVRWTQQGEAW